MDEKNQASLRLLWRQAKRLIAHLWPRKGAGTITFGFDDPYTTGQVLAAASMLYPFYYKQLTLCPIFEGGTVFEAQGSFRGRIRVVSLLWIGLGVLRDKHTRKMIFRLLRGGRA